MIKAVLNSKTKLISLIAFILMCFPLVQADGMLFVDRGDYWGIFNEEQQFAVINYHDGIQHMILTISTAQRLEGTQAVWIFPVPAQPSHVSINIIRGFPYFSGSDIKDGVIDSISESLVVMRASQIYTLPLWILFRSGGDIRGFGDARSLEVHARVEGSGLVTELISAEDAAAIKEYTDSNNLDLPEEALKILDDYIGQNYSFVISWIHDIEEYERLAQRDRMQRMGEYAELIEISGIYSGPRGFDSHAGNTLGVYLSFPTDRIFFPLKPTSIYGSKRVPANIYILDHVTPDLYRGIRRFTQTSYRYQKTLPVRSQEFFAGYQLLRADGEIYRHKIDNVNYTRIRINAPSNRYTEDLWIDSKPPKKIGVYGFIERNLVFIQIIIFLIISSTASLLSAISTFGFRNISKTHFALFGLLNILTLIGLTIASYVFRIDKRFTSLEIVEQNTMPLKKVLIKAALLTLFIPAFFLVLSLIFGDISISLIMGIITIHLIAILFVAPLVYIWYNKGLFRFILLFSVYFMILTMITPLILVILL